MKHRRKIILLIIIFVGLITPFIPSFTVIEMFFLLIPFAIIFLVTLIYLMISLLNRNKSKRKAIFIFSLLPIFIISQLVSVFTIDRTQRFRSKKIIEEIEKIKNETGDFPKQYDISNGIKYLKSKDNNRFIIEYSRGFMVTEKYDSKNKMWKSYGWND